MKGLTLAEVVAALALLGTLLVLILVSFSRHAVQIERAADRLDAMRGAEVLLAEWHLRYGFVPVDEEGEFTVNNKKYFWRTLPLERVIDESFQVGKVKFEVFSERSKSEIVLSLELAVPSWAEL